ncbi:MAG: hypothetical protein H8E46_11620 [FCB group bacterium]|nr:hypothetical protein [FCB group bacterium]
MYKWMEVLSWIFIGLAAVVMIFGLIAFLQSSPFLFSSRGCATMSISFLLFALNFSIMRWMKMKEEP